MKIGFICKYPPTKGGESAKTYWLTRALAEMGYLIRIITNAYEVEKEHRLKVCSEDIDFYLKIPNLEIRATPPNELPYYIPQGNPYEAKLASITLSLIETEGLDLIDSWYLVPNAIAAFLALSLVNNRIPWVIRHAGSDLTKLLSHYLLNPLLKKILLKADRIITYRSTLVAGLLEKQGVPKNKMWFNDKVSVNTRFFSPEGPTTEDLPKDKPVIMSIGKIAAVKGTYDLLRSFVPFKNAAYLVFITAGPKLNLLRKEVSLLGLEGAVKIFSPVSPWKIPSYLRGADIFVHAERDFPIATHRPISVREAMACGKCLLLSEEIFAKYNFLKRGENVLTMNPLNHRQFSSQLKFILDNPNLVSKIGDRAHETSMTIEDFPGYVDTTMELYESMIKNQLNS